MPIKRRLPRKRRAARHTPVKNNRFAVILPSFHATCNYNLWNAESSLEKTGRPAQGRAA
ncbi:hypothetical protein ANACOL_04335 [Anaerotruncus colihominis DSM 17241]|uniref:Uncharacterized protein n=1 Tax=Anaerotruncus colihominis DSM 17241 TaxID=445972 RepID=B0PHP2_9FIRM|nr:hypothetical protein ANACOL_04335 [Anaerotruncus colihominis DSM 17241]